MALSLSCYDASSSPFWFSFLHFSLKGLRLDRSLKGTWPAEPGAADMQLGLGLELRFLSILKGIASLLLLGLATSGVIGDKIRRLLGVGM